MRRNLFGMFPSEMQNVLSVLEVPKYRAVQIAEWIYKHEVTEFSKMTNLPAPLREILPEQFVVEMPVELRRQDSKDGKTTKGLLEFEDESAIETVLMRQSYGNSLCISSQVGCAMGCRFCASTLTGLERSLTSGEMLAQLFHANRHWLADDAKVDSVVVMGGGEPLANLPELLRFLRLCHDPDILGMGYRSFTVSTCGLAPGILALMDAGMPVTLSLSLHAPNDEIRSRLMPVNRKHPLEDVLSACDAYTEKTGRRITYEYALIADVNDRPEHAKELVMLLRGKLAAVNLIPLNPVEETGLLRSTPERTRLFQELLESRGIHVTVRREMGGDIDAACGQLRHRDGKGGNA